MATAPKGVTPARPKSKDGKDDKGKGKGGPVAATPFGSHAAMVNQELVGKILPDKQDVADPWTILTDDRGPYATRQSRLDSGLADPQRCADQPARDALVAQLTQAPK